MNKSLEESIKYLEQHMEITKEVLKSILRHCKRYNLRPDICAYYSDWEDFCSDWCDDLNYSRTEARRLYHGGKGEFVTFASGEILRFSM